MEYSPNPSVILISFPTRHWWMDYISLTGRQGWRDKIRLIGVPAKALSVLFNCYDAWLLDPAGLSKCFCNLKFYLFTTNKIDLPMDTMTNLLTPAVHAWAG